MTPAFWDASALVPLCVLQESSAEVFRLIEAYSVVVWWATPVEMRSAFQRLLRTGQLTESEYATAGLRFDYLRRGWRELEPSELIRTDAQRLLIDHTLKASDSLQLAAALIWSSSGPQSLTFIAGDGQLLYAARRVGFQAMATS